jgi:hypothetical protein
MSRTFIIEQCECKLPKEYNGLFKSNSPYSAAKKATAAIYRQSNSRKAAIRFEIRESTQDSAKKQFVYEGAKIKLSKEEQIPRMVKGKPLLDKNGKPVVIKHKYTVKAVK